MIPTKVFNLINDVIPMIILFLIMAVLLKIVSVTIGKRKGDTWIEFKIILYIIYSFVLFHLVTNNDFQSYGNNFIPFKEIMRYTDIKSALFIRNVIGNIAIFIPFGYIVADVIKMTCKKTNILITTLYVLLTSISIEVIQYFIGRAFDIDDIILNFVGGVLGYIAYKVIHIVLKEKN